jgi:hypothetical protein
MATTTYKNFKISAEFDGLKVAIWDEYNDRHSKVTIKNLENGKRTSFDFWGSIKNPRLESDYDLLNAFYCFVSDAISGLESFENFCGEFGYDTDSRKAEKTYKLCKRAYVKFERVSGFSDDEMYNFINELSEIAA